jgi:hypothetical protein
MNARELRMLNTACKIGEENCLRAIRNANAVKDLRDGIRRSLRMLRAGRIEHARTLLEKCLAGQKR